MRNKVFDLIALCVLGLMGLTASKKKKGTEKKKGTGNFFGGQGALAAGQAEAKKAKKEPVPFLEKIGVRRGICVVLADKEWPNSGDTIFDYWPFACLWGRVSWATDRRHRGPSGRHYPKDPEDPPTLRALARSATPRPAPADPAIPGPAAHA